MVEVRDRVQLEPPARRARRRWTAALRPLAWVGVLVLALRLVDDTRAIDCERAAHTEPAGRAAAVCQREYTETGSPSAGVRLAETLADSGDDSAIAVARQIATALATSAVQADAWRVLAQIRIDADELDDARVALTAARAQYAARRDLEGQTRADYEAVRLAYGLGRHAEALVAAAACARDAELAGVGHFASFCHMAAVRVLLAVGHAALATRQLALAEATADPSPSTQADLAYARGNLEQELGAGPGRVTHQRSAITALERALALDASVPARTLSIHLNLAYSYASLAPPDPDAAERHLAIAAALDPSNHRAGQRRQLAAQIAYVRGDLATASRLNTASFARADDDERVELAVMQARIALAGSPADLAGAVAWARAGVDAVERMRARLSILELRPWLLSSHRLPYELWFTALVRAGRLTEALIALDTWQARTVQDALVAPPAGGVAEAIDWVHALGDWPAATPRGFARPADAGDVAAALRQIDLLALVVADGEVWCLTSRAGAVHAHDLGTLAAFQPRLDAFLIAPTDAWLATELGEQILRDDVYRPTTAPLQVLLDGRFAALAVPALRRARPMTELSVAASSASATLIERRPVVRVFRLPSARCAPVPVPHHATILADAASNLPATRGEARALSSVPGLAAAVHFGHDANRAALFGLPDGDLLDLAMHAGVDAMGGVLMLAGGPVSAFELAAHRLPAALVILSACESARAQDDDLELHGALASAALAAGARRVIATVRVVSDREAGEIITAWIAAGGIADPVHALAKVQAARAHTADPEWPLFAIFGQDLCSTMY